MHNIIEKIENVNMTVDYFFVAQRFTASVTGNSLIGGYSKQRILKFSFDFVLLF